LLIACMTGSALAQNGSVSGHIVDGRGTTIAGVVVSVSSDKTKEVSTVKTNGEG